MTTRNPTRTPMGYRRAGGLKRVQPLAPRATFTPPPDADTSAMYDDIDRVQAKHAATVQALFANVCMWLVWFAGWLLNGLATVLMTIAVGQALGALLLRRGWIETAPNTIDWTVIGIIAHLVISRVEQYLWKPARWTKPPSMRNMQAWLDALPERLRALGTMRTAQAVIIGGLDSLSSGRAAMLLLFDQSGFLAAVVGGALGTGLAMSAEPMMGYHWGLIKVLWRQRCSYDSQLRSLRQALQAASAS